MASRSVPRPGGLVGPGLAAAVGAVAAAPLLFVPFFASDDGLVHLWRLWEYARAARLEGFPPRWAPDAAYGFGTPLFTFYNPLSYALGIPLMALGLGAGDATKTVFALSVLLSALGAYALGAAWNRRAPLAAGLCAALLYTLIPYRLATVYQRGALAEALGLGFAPWVVLFALRAGEARTARAAALLALASGALVLSHTIAALLALPFAAALGLARILELDPATRRRGLVVLVAGLTGGALLGAVYWLPAFAEQATVHLERARWTEVGGGFLGSFEWPWQLVQPSLVHDYALDAAAMRPAPARFPRVPALGALALALGAAALLRSAHVRPASAAVVAAGVVVPLALASPLALPLWRHVALLASVQLGWRFLAVILVAAIPIAASLPDLPVPRSRAIAVGLAGAVAVISLVRLPIAPIPWSAAYERPAELAFFERKTGEFALGALREYVPSAGDVTPEQLALEPAADAAVGAPEVDAALLLAAGAARRYRIATAAPATVTLDLFAHPSLAVRLDGAPAAPRAIGQEGLLAVDLPPGEHEIEVAPESTPVERAAGWLSAIALVAALGVLTKLRAALPATAATGVLAGIALAWPGAADAATALATTPAIREPVALGSDARVLGVVPDTSLVSSLGVLTLDVHVQALRHSPSNEPLDLALVRADGSPVAEAMSGPSGGLRPTSRWRPNELLVLRQELRLSGGLAAGDYRLVARMGRASAELGTVSVPAPGSVAAAALSAPFAEHESIFGDELVLDGYTYDRDPAARPLRGSFWWRSLADAAPLGYNASLRLVDKQGNVLASQTKHMGGAGDLRPQADFALLPDQPVPPESYRLELQVYPDGPMQSGPRLPARTFLGPPNSSLLLAWLTARDPCNCLPPGATASGVSFADGIGLAGWEVERRGADVALALYWRAQARPTRDYTAFVHLMDGDRMVGQFDDQPNGGARPTSGWQPGEIVPDRYHLHSSTGGATVVQVGLYLPANGQRLPLDPPAGDQAVTLPIPPETGG